MKSELPSELSQATCNCSGCPSPFSHDDLLDLLDGKELDPGLGAYEELDPALRACLKSQIALLHKMWSPCSSRMGTFRILSEGTLVREDSVPQDWVLFIMGEEYSSPAGFIAALLPALISGVPQIYIWRQGRRDLPLHPAISAAMELLGLEEIYGLAGNECGALFWRLVEHTPAGRSSLVLLGDIQNAEDYLTLAQERGVCQHSLPANLKIGVEGVEPDQDLLAWLHPGAALAEVRAGAVYDALIAESDPNRFATPDKYATSLVLPPEYTYLWLWPQVQPAAFHYKQFMIAGNKA